MCDKIRNSVSGIVAGKNQHNKLKFDLLQN